MEALAEPVGTPLQRLREVRAAMDELATAHCLAMQNLGPSPDLAPLQPLIEEVEALLRQDALNPPHGVHAKFIVGCGWHMLGIIARAFEPLMCVVHAPAGTVPASDHLTAILVVLPMLRKANQWAEIVAASDKAREVASGTWANHTLPYVKGIALCNLGMTAEAAELFEQAINLQPGFHQAYVEYDKCMASLRDFTACRRMAQKLVDYGGYWVNAWQRPDHFLRDPLVASQPWYDAHDFAIARELEAGFLTILAELEAFELPHHSWGRVGQSSHRGNDHSSHDADLVSTGEWSEVVLLGDAAACDENGVHFPETLRILRNHVEVVECAATHLGESLFSRLAPGTHLRPHCGPSNMRLTCHLGLHVPEGCEITCGGETRHWREGQCLTFDDSFEHEVRHNGDLPRVVLLVNFWHPGIASDRWAALMRSVRREEGVG